jgi:hypothetical protein
VIPQVILKLVIPKVLDIVVKQFKLDKMERLIEYMDSPNDADNKIEALEERLKTLEENSHPPRKFVKCEDCKNKIKEK